MSSLATSMHKEQHDVYADQVEGVIDVYRKNIFETLITKIEGGDVCDLGGHSISHYWALGYADRVDSFSCYDVLDYALSLQVNFMENLSEDIIFDKYKSTLDYLSENNAPIDPEYIGGHVAEKFRGAYQFDFLKDKPSELFDAVLAISSLEVVNSIEEFEQSVATACSLLKPSGMLLAQILPYADKSRTIDNLCDAGLESMFNPDLEMIKSVFSSSNFSSYEIISKETEIRFYPTAHFIVANR